MGSVLADTNALYWFLFEPEKLSRSADAALTDADKTAGEHIYYSVISLAELVYLTEKGKMTANVLNETIKYVSNSKRSFRAIEIDLKLAVSLEQIPRRIVSDLPDRIIAASGWMYSLPVVTADAQIRRSSIATIW